MRRLRISIAGLASVILVIALGLTTLRYASTAVASAVVSACFLLFGLGILGVIYRRGESRAFWTGFVLFGAGYGAFLLGPWESIPAQGIEILLDRLNESMNPAVTTYHLTSVRGGDVIDSSPSLQAIESRLAAIEKQCESSDCYRVVATFPSGTVLNHRFLTRNEADALAKTLGFVFAQLERRQRFIQAGPATEPVPDGVEIIPEDSATSLRIAQASYSPAARDVFESFRWIGNAFIGLAIACVGGYAGRFFFQRERRPITFPLAAEDP